MGLSSSLPNSIVKPGVTTSTSLPSAPYDGQVLSFTDTDSMALYNGAAWQGIPQTAGFRNAIINGGMDVWQRGTSIVASALAYSADRWDTRFQATGRTISRQTINSGNIRYAARHQRDNTNATTTPLGFVQTLETTDSIAMQGKVVTLSVYVRVGANWSGTTFDMNVITGTGTDEQSRLRAAFTGDAIPMTATWSPTTSFVRYTVTGTIASTATQIAANVAHSNFSGTAGANDWIEFANVQLELGSVATPFERRPYGTELALCQRYYQTTGAQGIVPGNGRACMFTLYTPMRVAPVITTGNLTNAETGAVLAAGPLTWTNLGQGAYQGAFAAYAAATWVSATFTMTAEL